jgi:hypothetical protein
MASVEDRVTLLEQFDLPDDQPLIEGPSSAIRYSDAYDPNFVDTSGFKTKWAEETQTIAEMVC